MHTPASSRRHVAPARTPLRRVSLAAVTLALAACGTEPAPPTGAWQPSATLSAQDAHAGHAGANVAVTPGHLRAAEQVRKATAVFADVDAAKAAGYDLQFPAGCAKSPAGAQGFHYLNQGLVDNKTDVLRPELVMYEPQADGSMVLVGVDYIIPFSEWKSPQPPVLLGIPMLRNEPLGVWALHIWAQRPNPSGLFAAWNPDVSCANEGAVTP